MFPEHTHLHKRQTGPGKGEFIELTMRIALVERIQSDSFENWSGEHPEQYLNPMRRGALAGISGHGLGALTVALIEARWLATDTPECLFEQGARICAEEALRKLTTRTG